MSNKTATENNDPSVPSTATVSAAAASAAATPSDVVAWVDAVDGTIGKVDLGTGAVTPVGNSGVILTDIALTAAGQLYGASFDSLYSINQSTGKATLIGAFGVTTSLNGLEFSPNGLLYGSAGTGLFVINTGTGAATLVGQSGVPGGFGSEGDIAFLNGTLYEAVSNGSVSDLARIDPTTGAGVLVGQMVGNASMFGLVAGSDGVLYGLDGTSIYAINTITGAATLLRGYDATKLGAANGATTTTTTTNPTGALTCLDTTTGRTMPAVAQTYSGPVAGLSEQYISITADSLNITVSTPGWFLHSGSGTDALAVSSGTNVLDGGTGSNFLTGGSGTDTFFVDDRGPSADIWSTVNNCHTGDSATVWGVSPQEFTLTWVDGQGATGYTGLTLHATAAGKPTASLTLAGFSRADLNDGRLSVSYGTSDGSAYMYVHANS